MNIYVSSCHFKIKKKDNPTIFTGNLDKLSLLKNHLQRSIKVSPLVLLKKKKKNISLDFTDEQLDEVSTNELVLPADPSTLN